MVDLDALITETRNPETNDIDQVSTLEMVQKINAEDKKVAYAVEKEGENIAIAVDAIYDKLKNGGRLIYMGAGTSGRLGILDASECPPTYGVSEELVRGLIAGGHEAIFRAVEGAEDDRELGKKDLQEIDFDEKDALVGIAASGRTPYVIGGLEYANSIGCTTIGVTCNPASEISQIAKISISPVVGPEAVTGSTRMKAGTAQKLVLNTLTTATMIKLGKVYGNLMVDVQPSNEKLIERCKRIVVEATNVTIEEATHCLEKTDYNVKLAILLIQTGAEVEEGRKVLKECDGYLTKAIQMIKEL
jgi:N-acetylmuramic acid 6-phosphate etherase